MPMAQACGQQMTILPAGLRTRRNSPSLVCISPAQAMGCIKGKSAIHIARVYAERRVNFVGQHFWARGYWVSTVAHYEVAVCR